MRNMATAKPHVYRVPRTHSVAGKVPPGQVMAVRMRMLPPDADDASFPMEEVSAEPEKPADATGRKSPIQFLKEKRRKK